jgi:hypothetical protein
MVMFRGDGPVWIWQHKNQGKIGYLPKSSLALDYLPKVDYTLVKYPKQA